MNDHGSLSAEEQEALTILNITLANSILMQINKNICLRLSFHSLTELFSECACPAFTANFDESRSGKCRNYVKNIFQNNVSQGEKKWLLFKSNLRSFNALKLKQWWKVEDVASSKTSLQEAGNNRLTYLVISPLRQNLKPHKTCAWVPRE